jgi:hypothetical protein
MTYRLARSLEVLRNEVNDYAPNRSKVSDGWIGDAAHASRGSDHNPWIIDAAGIGVVRAFDFTHDPFGGLDCDVLAERIRALGGSGDRRLADGGYVIWRSRIASGYAGNWTWRPYSGSNPHERHVHVSVSREASAYDAGHPWQVTGAGLHYRPTPTIPKGFTVTEDERLILRRDMLEQANKAVAPVLAALKAALDSRKIAAALAIALESNPDAAVDVDELARAIVVELGKS